jgi:hypothetical protein
MTEAEWLAGTQTSQMLKFLGDQTSERKLRLFAVGCCRRIWHSLPNEQSRRTVEIAERYADGMATAEELMAAREQVLDWYDLLERQDFEGIARARFVADSARIPLTDITGGPSPLIRCVFGNPFRPVVIDSAWRTPKVVTLAQVIYEEKAFDRMSVLGDALEEAGCDNADILAHCRSEAEHVRGCWVVDFILGKS